MTSAADIELESIFKLFHKENPVRYNLEEIRCDDGDHRWVIFTEFERGKYVIKIAANDFTTRERVDTWPDIISEYRKMGYYSPAMRKTLDGCYSKSVVFKGEQCVVWEEEFVKYKLCDMLDKRVYTNKDGRYVFHNEVMEFMGRVAQKHFTNYPFPSGWVRLKPFGRNESADEITRCVETFDRLVREKTPKFIPRWERILELFERNKTDLSEIYDKLPTSVFQADLGKNNLVLDENGHLKGVIDYNLSGSDTVLNIFLSTILFGYSYQRKHIVSPNVFELNEETQSSIFEIILDTFRYLRNFYTFSEAEAEAAPLLLKYISCIEYTQINILKKYIDDGTKLNLLFDFMEKQLLRDPIDFRKAMFG